MARTGSNNKRNQKYEVVLNDEQISFLKALLSMNETTSKLAEGNEKVEQSLESIRQMNQQMNQIKDRVDNAFEDIDRLIAEKQNKL